MKNFLLVLFLTASIAFSPAISHAQYLSRTVVANAAETFTSNNFSMTYVLGETVGELLPNPGANLYLTAGFSQPDVDVQTVLTNNYSNSLIVYPNPANGSTIKLAFNHVPDGTYLINLVDASGKILTSQTVTYSSSTFFYLPIDISQLSGGTYFISVTNQSTYFQGQVKLIKI